ncbi:MAG: DUF1629 domain-containing protein [bacterium]
MIWENGRIIDPKKYDLSRLEFLCETLPSGKMTDYAVSDMGCSVISERFKFFLDSLGIDNIQYVKATVIERDGEPAKPGYYAANILGLVDCIDRDASEMDAELDDDGELTIIFRIDKLVLKDDVFYQAPLFRTAHFTGLILLDETLKQKIDKSPLIGVRLVSPVRWDGIYGEV